MKTYAEVQQDVVNALERCHAGSLTEQSVKETLSTVSSGDQDRILMHLIDVRNGFDSGWRCDEGKYEYYRSLVDLMKKLMKQ